MAAKGKGREALYTSVGPAAHSTPGTIDHGAGDEEAPFLDGEPYDFPYELSLGEDPQQDQEEEEEDYRRNWIQVGFCRQWTKRRK